MVSPEVGLVVGNVVATWLRMWWSRGWAGVGNVVATWLGSKLGRWDEHGVVGFSYSAPFVARHIAGCR